MTTVQGGKAIVDAALDEFGGLDAVVNNAGIFHTQQFEDLTTENWRRMLRVHLDGAFHVSQPAYREMKRRGYGRFVFAASSAGLFGQPPSAHYAAAKAGVVGLANVIAIEPPGSCDHGAVHDSDLDHRRGLQGLRPARDRLISSEATIEPARRGASLCAEVEPAA